MTSATLARRAAYRAATSPDTRRVAIFLYVRISRDPEGMKLGVRRQGEDLRAWAHRDHPEAVVFDGVAPDHPEGYSDNDRGASTRSRKPRPEYNRLLRDARAAGESGTYSRVIVAAYTSSRLTRRPREGEDLIELAERSGVTYYFLRSPAFDLNTAAGRQIARVLAATDAGEAETTAERILRAKQQQLVDGVYTGGARPFGYQIERDYGPSGQAIPGTQRLVLDEREAAAIRDGVRAFLAGTSLRALARDWNAAGLRTATKQNLWSPTQVRKVLARGRNAGLSENHGELMGRGQWPAIISQDELIAVRAKLADPARKSHHGSYSRRWLGSALYKCGQPGCDALMRSSGGHRGSATRYACRARGHCVIDAAAVDLFVLARIAGLIAKYGPALVDDHSEEADRLDHEARVLRGKVEALDHEYGDGDGPLTLRAYSLQTRKLEDRLAAVEQQRATVIVPNRVLDGIESAEDFLNASLERQRAIADAVATVTILPGRRGRQPAGYKITDRVRITPRTAIT